jgi:very-short-patch-repair endonuclease
MGIQEAVAHGIKYRSQGRATWYEVNCSMCGKKHESRRFNPEHLGQYKCTGCKKKLSEQNEKIDLFAYCKKENKFEKATSRINAMVKKPDDYVQASKLIHKYLHKKGWFQSTEEIVAAIELVKNKIKVIHQQKIKGYTVDFILPDLKVALEIDGEIYHTDMQKDAIRDCCIEMGLGVGWKVIRIKTKLINTNINKLVPEIIKAKSKGLLR